MIFIPGNVPSSKNNRVWTGKFFVESKACKKWRIDTKAHWQSNLITFRTMLQGKTMPYKVGLHFVRGTKHKYDWVNPVQTIQDEMVKHDWLQDDNTEIMFPFPLRVKGFYESYDKENPGVYITVL